MASLLNSILAMMYMYSIYYIYSIDSNILRFPCDIPRLGNAWGGGGGGGSLVTCCFILHTHNKFVTLWVTTINRQFHLSASRKDQTYSTIKGAMGYGPY